MVENNPKDKKISPKSPHALREESILAFWKEKGIFEKTLNKFPSGKAPKGEFIFYEGPPTANGRPGIHHLEARAFKDVIPRYRTMRGYHVNRKGGWDTHGLPVELQVEKQLGLKSKKEIEKYGIEAFNDRCKESVWTYVHEWEDFTARMGYWVDLKDPYITYKPAYMESVWNVIKTADDKSLLYKDYKVVPWCPRCGTALSSHELAQGYENVKDLTVYVKFKAKTGQKISDFTTEDQTYILAWTTTPWTLPGNVGLAVGEKIDYVQVRSDGISFILAKARLSVFKGTYSIEKTFKGSDLVGLSYEPLYPFEKDNISGPEKDKLKNAYKVYAADFVTTEDGTGIVHIAPMYGQDDFELGTKVGLPKYHLVNEDGTFKKETGFLAGAFVKDENVTVAVIKDLANRPTGSLLFDKEKYEHTYPFCWRCHTPLIYFARDSWYIRMSSLRDELVKENEGIHWEPEHIKEGRFGEWLREVKDWAISRERYWGTPLPVWICDKCHSYKVAGSVADISQKPRNTYYVIRHGEAENNVLGILSGSAKAPHHLTAKGREQVADSAERLKRAVSKNGGFDLMVVSPFVRTRETADIIKYKLGLKPGQIIFDERLQELDSGVWDGRSIEDFFKEFSHDLRFEKGPEGGENYSQIKKRVGDFLYDMEKRYEGKTILVVTHETPAYLLFAAAHGSDREQSLELRKGETFVENAEWHKLDFSILPHDHEYQLDLHKPYIDEVKLPCSQSACRQSGGEMKRVKEVMDVWFDSGAMPFAQAHYPFEAKKRDGWLGKIFPSEQKLAYPADFISEAIDQTRGWFYTLHAIGTIMGKGKAFKNVICLGHLLDPQGKKMSKHIGNVVNPWDMMDKYGADALRFWMYSINQPGESKNFDEKTVDEVVKKVFNLISNTATFYKMYADDAVQPSRDSTDVLDRWIIARLDQLVSGVTTGLDGYVLLEPARDIRDFTADLSQWYLRRSRDRFKGEGDDKREALATIRYVLLTLAKVMAPFTPFFAEELYRDIGGDKESVHLEDWPTAGKIDEQLLKDMAAVRLISSKGLEARSSAKINVRQPLSQLKIKNPELEISDDGLVRLIKDEVNVKEVVFAASEKQAMTADDNAVMEKADNAEKEVELDTVLTAELKEEGQLRELLRKVQDLRKERGLTIGDKASLMVPTDLWPLAHKYDSQIKKTTNLTSIVQGNALSLGE